MTAELWKKRVTPLVKSKNGTTFFSLNVSVIWPSIPNVPNLYLCVTVRLLTSSNLWYNWCYAQLSAVRCSLGRAAPIWHACNDRITVGHGLNGRPSGGSHRVLQVVEHATGFLDKIGKYCKNSQVSAELRWKMVPPILSKFQPFSGW